MAVPLPGHLHLGRLTHLMTNASKLSKGDVQRRPSSLRRWGMIITGAVGVAILIGLCVWQVQRLAWKQDIIEKLEARLALAPTELPKMFDPETQEFLRVRVEGKFLGETGKHGFVDAPLLTSRKFIGPGYRIIQPFDLTDGRRIMVDRGFAPVAVKNERGIAARPIPAPNGLIEVTGALRWPEVSSDPAYGENDNVWTARDLSAMARLFGAEEVLVVSETQTAVADWPKADPIQTVNIRNHHLEYAITWAALAIGWAVMTGFLIFRPDRRSSRSVEGGS